MDILFIMKKEEWQMRFLRADFFRICKNLLTLHLVPFLLVRHDSRRREMERTTWIAGVSHDIRTPLSLVLGYADEILHIAEETGKSEKMGGFCCRVYIL